MTTQTDRSFEEQLAEHLVPGMSDWKETTRRSCPETVAVIERMDAEHEALGEQPRPGRRPGLLLEGEIRARMNRKADEADAAREEWSRKSLAIRLTAARELVRLAQQNDPLAAGIVHSHREIIEAGSWEATDSYAAWKGSYDGDY